jgi:hypothetical protein
MSPHWILINHRKAKHGNRLVFRDETLRATKTVLIQQGKLPQIEYCLDGTDQWYDSPAVLLLEWQRRAEAATR